MPLQAGQRVGGYQVIDLIGAGGMGEVYRARDLRLQRDVAIKVLSPQIAPDADALARFEREARMLAALSHPNIAAIHGVEEAGAGQLALVLEFVAGETLAERLARGRLSTAEAIGYARQMVDALDAAHEAGIVHRDLKPGNITITPDGTVKVLDFGLAKALQAAGDQPPDVDPAHSPTITVHGTRHGVILGTAAYMSPEQARGKPIDKRTDIWAFGCVLYEMLSGSRAFTGETTSDLIAAIIERPPDWSRLPALVPASVRSLIERCLQKDPRRRLRDIADARIELDAPERPAPPAGRAARLWPIAAGVALALGGLAALVGRGDAPAPPSVALTMLPPPGTSLPNTSIAAVSPDGSRVVFAAMARDGVAALWVRSIGQPTAVRLDGTEGAVGRPFWSPDGAHVGFVAEGKLKRIPASGGPVLALANIAGGNLGATWGSNDVIVFALGNRTALHRVPAGGGRAEPVTTLDAARENSHRWPSFLPDGEHVLFTTRSDHPDRNVIAVLSLETGAIKPLRPAVSDAVYARGSLLFVERGTLMAQRFDLDSLEVVGAAAALVSPVRHNLPSSQGFLSASRTGDVITYAHGAMPSFHLMWFDRRGAHVGTIGPPRPYEQALLAPDQQRLIVDIPDIETGRRELWVVQEATGALTRLTTHPATDWAPAWSPDSSMVAFASDRAGFSSVYVKPADGSRDETLVYRGDNDAFPDDWTPDGRAILVRVDRVPGHVLLSVPVDGGAPVQLLGGRNLGTTMAVFSPDGQWLAYASRETGESEVYVSSPAGAHRTRVSIAGGTSPAWRADGRELYFQSSAGDLMAAAVTPGNPPAVAPPVRLFTFCRSTTMGTGNQPSPDFSPSRDGARFVTRCAAIDNAVAAFDILVNWRAEGLPAR